MAANAPFYPQSTVNIAATTTSQNVALPSSMPSTYQMAEGDTVMITNTSAAIAFVEFGADNTVVANPAISFPVPAGLSRVLDVGQYAKFAAAVLSTGTGAVYFSRGKGFHY